MFCEVILSGKEDSVTGVLNNAFSTEGCEPQEFKVYCDTISPSKRPIARIASESLSPGQHYQVRVEFTTAIHRGYWIGDIIKACEKESVGYVVNETPVEPFGEIVNVIPALQPLVSGKPYTTKKALDAIEKVTTRAMRGSKLRAKDITRLEKVGNLLQDLETR